MQTVIVGARGMLGSALAHVFAEDQPVLWDKAEIDITDASEVREALEKLSPTLIINAAAYTDVDGAETQPETAFAVNEQGVRNLALAAKNIGATLVHYSTDYVFPGTAAAGYAEDEQPGPAVNVYGESKLAGEQALREVNPRRYLLRTAWLYGPGGKNFVDTMLKLAQTKPELNVVNDQHGSPTFTYDVASATRTLLTNSFAPGIYHAVNSGRATWYEVAQKILALRQLPITVRPVSSAEFPRPAARPQYSMLKNTKGPPLRPWEEALDDYLKNYTVSTSPNVL